jgi:FMN phosphatase YigB (HAD superfamily)
LGPESRQEEEPSSPVVSPWFGSNWQHLLITDVDNTLFDFGLYVETGLQALLPEISTKLGISKEEAGTELKEGFRYFNSVETPFAFERMASVASLDEHLRFKISKELADVFWQAASSEMAPYPGVLNTMDHLWRNGTAIVAVTDAPIFEVWRKLRHMGLFRYMAGIVGVEPRRRVNPLLSHEDVPNYERPRRSNTRFYRFLSGPERKPSPRAYQCVLDEIPVDRSRVTVIGDSPTKDLVPAVALGLSAYWAEYGERNRHLEQVLKRVTPFEPPEAIRSQASAAQGYGVLRSFVDLESIIEVRQERLIRSEWP